MYFFERTIYTTRKEVEDDPKLLAAEKASAAEAQLIEETGHDSKGQRYIPITESISDNPRASGAIYIKTRNYLDVRTPWDEKRGFITIVVLVGGMFASIAGQLLITQFLPELFSGHYLNGEAFDWLDYLLVIITTLLHFPVVPLYLYFLLRFGRLEVLVQRRILVRFDRKNRKVYLHRPKLVGGLITLDWDKIGPYPESELKGVTIGQWLTLDWAAKDSPNQRSTVTMVGRPARDVHECNDLWEYIRRFMQEGPQSVPRVKTLGKIPWPWKALRNTFSLYWPDKWDWFVIPATLLIPAALVFAFAQWVSLLLCWEPVFPRKIRKACGESFLDVIEAKLVDLIAWSMLAALMYAMWPLLVEVYVL